MTMNEAGEEEEVEDERTMKVHRYFHRMDLMDEMKDSYRNEQRRVASDWKDDNSLWMWRRRRRTTMEVEWEIHRKWNFSFGNDDRDIEMMVRMFAMNFVAENERWERIVDHSETRRRTREEKKLMCHCYRRTKKNFHWNCLKRVNCLKDLSLHCFVLMHCSVCQLFLLNSMDVEGHVDGKYVFV